MIYLVESIWWFLNYCFQDLLFEYFYIQIGNNWTKWITYNNFRIVYSTWNMGSQTMLISWQYLPMWCRTSSVDTMVNREATLKLEVYNFVPTLDLFLSSIIREFFVALEEKERKVENWVIPFIESQHIEIGILISKYS